MRYGSQMMGQKGFWRVGHS